MDISRVVRIATFPLGRERGFIATRFPGAALSVPRMSVRQIVCNAPCPGFVVLTRLELGGRNLLSHEGELVRASDAFVYGPTFNAEVAAELARDSQLEVSGTYTGFVPDKYLAAEFGYPYEFPFCVTLIGEAP